jgi:hypothetical protein
MGIQSPETVTLVTKVTKLGRPLIGKIPLSNAEKQRRYRIRRKAQTIT